VIANIAVKVMFETPVNRRRGGEEDDQRGNLDRLSIVFGYGVVMVLRAEYNSKSRKASIKASCFPIVYTLILN